MPFNRVWTISFKRTEHIERHQGAGDVSDASEDSQNEESSDPASAKSCTSCVPNARKYTRNLISYLMEKTTLLKQ